MDTSQSRTYKHIKYIGNRPKNDRDNHCRELLSLLVKDLGCFYEICFEKLYLIYLAKDENSSTFHNRVKEDPKCPFIFWFFQNEPTLTYEAFDMDFGPFNLATTHLFCSKLKIWLDTQALRDPDKYIAIVVDDSDSKRKLNATLLVAIAAMVLLNMTDIEVIQRLGFFMLYKTKPGELKKELTFREKKKFSDVSGNQSALSLTLEDCIKGFYSALQLRWYDYYEFDHGEYLFYETVMSGDINWIVPNKILAFAGPNERQTQSIFHHGHSPRFYYHYFKDHNVTTIIRLNEPEYEASSFTELGFDHYDLIFPDGYPPTSTIAAKFIKIVDEAKGAVAVHCYAGIGRTGTLIAAYLMTRYNFTPQMAIAWTRICRPGSVIGDQQDWLFTRFDPYSIDKATKTPTRIKKTKATANLTSSFVGDSNSSLMRDDAKMMVDSQKLQTPTKAPITDEITYAMAEKTYGQAKALLLTKKKREKASELFKPCTRNSTNISKKIADAEANAALSQANKRLDLIINLGKTIPIGIPIVGDFEDYKQSSLKDKQDGLEYYRIKDEKYVWKVKYPKPNYIGIRYGKPNEQSSMFDSSQVEPVLDFKYEIEKEYEVKCNNGSKLITKLKPIVYLPLYSNGETITIQ